MRRRLAVAAAVWVTGTLVAASSADAFLIQDQTAPQSGTNGIVLGPDGNFWVAEEFTDTVARMSPAGALLNRYTVGVGPTTVTTGPGGRVWVAVTGAAKLTWFDATAATPSAHDVPTGTACGPVAIAAGGDGRMYLSMPSNGICNAGVSLVGSVADNGIGAIPTVATAGNVFDLAVASGKLFAPDFDGGVVRRLSLGVAPAVESVVTATPGSGPDGVTADGAGNVWVTLYNSGKVARFPATQTNGAAVEFTPAGGTLTNPFGIVAGADGRMYVAGSGSANIVRISADGTSFRFYGHPGSQPFNIVNGPDGDLFATDYGQTRILRLVNSAPRAATSVTTAATTSASPRALVNPRGNATQVVFDYGLTAAYGATSAPVTVPNGANPVLVTGVLTGLAPATTYHVRVRAANAEGPAIGGDTTFKTAAMPDLADFKASPKSLRVSKTGRFTYSFVATPGRKGKAKLASTKSVKIGSKKRKMKVGAKSFTPPANGKVKVKFKLSSKNLKALKRRKSLKFNVTVTVGSTNFTAKLTLKPPKK